MSPILLRRMTPIMQQLDTNYDSFAMVWQCRRWSPGDAAAQTGRCEGNNTHRSRHFQHDDEAALLHLPGCAVEETCCERFRGMPAGPALGLTLQPPCYWKNTVTLLILCTK